MLMQRLITALVLIPVVIIALFFLPLDFFAAVIILLCGLAVWEWTQFLGITSFNSRRTYALISIAILALIYYLSPVSALGVIFTLSLFIALLWWLAALFLVLTYPKCAVVWQKSTLLKSLFGLLTLFPFFTGMIVLRAFSYAHDQYVGAFWLLYVLVLVWATDSGAYFAGRLLGKHKLAPHVSPGKTIEGFIGGVVTSLLIAFFVNTYFNSVIPFRTVMFASFMAILASVLGDLTESMFKRAAGIKDSGHLIPGHGGVLDRIDSLTSAIPVFVAFAFFVS